MTKHTATLLLGLFTKLFSSGVKFLSVPLLLIHLGESNFGVLSLVLSLGAYTKILDAGLNNSFIRFISFWKQKGKNLRVKRLFFVSLLLYLLIALVNFLLLMVAYKFSGTMFSLNEEQSELFKNLVIVSFFVSFFTWLSFPFLQFLQGAQKVWLVYVLNIIASCFELVALIYVVFYNNSTVSFYFVFYFLSSAFVLLFLTLFFYFGFYNSLSYGFQKYVASNRALSKAVFTYGVLMFFMGIAQISASEIRPLILGIQLGAEEVGEYRIINMFGALITMLGAVFMQVFLPYASRLFATRNTKQIVFFLESSTRLMNIFSWMCFSFCFLCGQLLIKMYVGPDYLHLSNWLVVCAGSVSLVLTNSGVSAFVFATGRVKPILISSYFSLFVLILISWYSSPFFGVGSVFIAYLAYVLCQLAVYFFYYYPVVLKSSFIRNYCKPFFLCLICFLIVNVLDYGISFLDLSEWALLSVTAISITSVFGFFNLKFLLGVFLQKGKAF
jgi:O-antigen/teichoic acid export membrane protein